MNSIKFRVSRLFVIGADCAAIALAQIIAYLFRFEFSVSAEEVEHLVFGILLLIPVKIFIFYWFGLYKGMWRFTGMSDLQNLVKANIVASLIIITSLLLINRFQGLSRSIFLMDGVLCFLFTSGVRIFIRLYCSHKRAGAPCSFLRFIAFMNNKKAKGVPTLLLGAGSAGEALVREIASNPSLNIQPVGFLDDAPEKKGRSLHGIPVLDTIDRAKEVAAKFNVQQIFIAIPSASAEELRKIVKCCEDTGLPYKTLPGMGNIIDGSIRLKDLRDVNYEDLLGRPPVELDDIAISRYLENNTVLVTGAGGSIGSELCRQIVKYRPSNLIVLDHSEFNLFAIDAELKKFSSDTKMTSLLGRVQDDIFMENIFSEYNPRAVFHAAAFKHVHLVERFPWEGVFNNIVGSKVLMETAVRHGVERFVVVSTDKAVRPTSVMGACKRVTELLARSLNGGDTKIMAVRFGNVVGSSGSVVPIFREQIQQGGPVTVTHPDATRFFMTIPEASKLILQAGAIGNGGEIFILEMGTPVKIMQMAEDLIRLSGKEPYKDIEIVITGLRNGEKIDEELITNDESILDTIHNKIMVLSPSSNGNPHYNNGQFMEELSEKLDKLCDAAATYDSHNIRITLKEIVPEYMPPDLSFDIPNVRATYK